MVAGRGFQGVSPPASCDAERDSVCERDHFFLAKVSDERAEPALLRVEGGADDGLK